MEVNPDDAWAGIGEVAWGVHNAHMPNTARKLKPKQKQRQAWALTQLRAWREYRKIKIVDAAEHTGIKHSQLSRIERGLQQYKQEHLEALARLYRTSIWALLYCPPGLPEHEVFSTFQRTIRPLSDI